MKKIQRHVTLSVRDPPMTGPRTDASPTNPRQWTRRSPHTKRELTPGCADRSTVLPPVCERYDIGNDNLDYLQYPSPADPLHPPTHDEPQEILRSPTERRAQEEDEHARVENDLPSPDVGNLSVCSVVVSEKSRLVRKGVHNGDRQAAIKRYAVPIQVYDDESSFPPPISATILGTAVATIV